MSDAALRRFRWHGWEIESRLPLAFAPSFDDQSSLRKLRISSNCELEPPQDAMLAQVPSRVFGCIETKPTAGWSATGIKFIFHVPKSGLRRSLPDPSSLSIRGRVRWRCGCIW